MISTAIALRPVGYRCEGGKQTPIFNIDPEIEGIFRTSSERRASAVFGHLLALRRIGAAAAKKTTARP
jgi:hypothetical protein